MVTDEDRRAAAEWMAERMALVMGGESGSGEQSLIEAFARHRLAAEQRGYQQGMEDAAGVAEATFQKWAGRSDGDGWAQGAFDCLAAIRAKAEEKKHGTR